MSTSGQGDQISETNKDDESEISSTTTENEGLQETVGKSNELSAAAAIDPEDTETSKAVKIVPSDLPSSSSDKKPATAAVTASTAAEIEESSNIIHERCELRVDTNCDVGSTQVSPPKASSSGFTKDAVIGSLNPGGMKDIPEIIQAEHDKDSSLEEDIKLRSDNSDDAENDASEPSHTDYVLEMLNKELGEEALEKPDTVKITSEEGTINSVNKSDQNEEKDVIKTTTANDSFEESQKIITEIDSLTQDDEIDTTTELFIECKNPVTVDKSSNQPEDDKKPKDALELEKLDIEKSEPETVSIEIPLKPVTEENEEMDVEGSGDITQDKEIKEENDVLNVTVASDLYDKSQKTAPQLDKLTQDERDITVELQTVTVDDLDKQLENVEIPNDELIESEKLNIAEPVTKTVPVEISFKKLTKDDEEMDVDKSEGNKKGTLVVKLNTTATVSFEECQKSITENDSLNQDDKIEKTAELPSESDNPITVEELDKQLGDVKILKNESDKSEKPDIEESKPKTKVIGVPSKLLSEDDEVMDLDDSNDVDEGTSTVDDFMAEVTKPQENTLDGQKEKVESIKDMEVLDNIEDKQATSNISHDIITEDLKPVETVTSEYDISSTEKTILKEDTKITVKDELINKAIEDISEISQPVDDKNKESEAVDTIQDLDDKLRTMQSIDNNSQKMYETASMQDGKKSSDEQNITHKSSESQAIDCKVTSTQEMDDETLKAENILINTETENKLGENTSIIDDSLIDTTISPNKHHRINKPNVMLDIPTQEFSDIEAELSDSEINDAIKKPQENTENIEKPTKIDEKPTEANKMVNVLPEISRNATPTIQIDATTSKLNITTVSPTKLKQASSKDVKIDETSSTKTQDILTKTDDENVAEKKSQELEKSDDDPSSSRQVEQPSSSTDNGNNKLEKLTSDDADEVQESDTLGLLAESSRVHVNMDDAIGDDEEEPEELEPDDNDNDDDDDFDPYDESSSQMMEDLEDTDESNPPTEEKILKSKVIDADEQTDHPPVEQPDRITNILEKVLGNKCELKQPSVGSVLNYVEVEGSSDSDDVEEISKPSENLISVKVPAEVDVMLTSGAEGGTSAMHSNKDEVVISVPKPQSQKMAKINTSEVTIKSASKNLESIQIPETTSVSEKKGKDEVFNIDSDDEEEKIEELAKENQTENSLEALSPSKSPKCINPHCTDTSGVYSKASRATVAYYSLARRSGAACLTCTERASERSRALVMGIKDLRPLMALDMEAPSHQLVEISDSDEDEEPVDESEKIGEKGAKFIMDNLVDVINEVWLKYDMDARLKQTEAYLNTEMDLITAGAEELNALLDAVQNKTDAIRTDFYKDYEPKRRHTGGIVIHDTPFMSFSHTEKDVEEAKTPSNRYPKRRSASNIFDPPAAKKHASTVKSLDKEKTRSIDQAKMEEDKDISVVKLSAESAPASLPPHGELARPALYAGMSVYAMRNAFGTWNKARILEIVQEATPPTVAFTQCRVKFEHKVKNSCKVLAARCMAYSEPCEVRYTIGTRVVGLFKDPQSSRMDAFYAGVVAEVPNPVNNYRYLVFFDDGYAQYVQHADTRLVCEASALVWEEVHPFIHDFVKNYLKSYPARAMVRLKEGASLNTEWNGKWWTSQVMQVDASIALIHFDQDDRTEWIYRGSTRLEPLYLEMQVAKARGKTRSRLPRNRQIRSNMPCVEYTRSDEQAGQYPRSDEQAASANSAADMQAQQGQNEQLRPERAVAKKSTTERRALSVHVFNQGAPLQGISRVVYYTPKYSTKPLRMEPHTCNPSCGKRADILPLQQLRTYNPLAKPLLSGWERQTVRFRGSHRVVMYRAPCGRRLRNMQELHRWLCMQESDFSVDLFDFTVGTHCLAEFCLDKIVVGKKDLSHGKENVPVPCVNYYDKSLPEFCSYNTERTPTAGVPLNLDPDFLCGCDCTDDCQDKSKCACWKMTLEGARTIGLEGDNIGYVYRRLPEPLPSGIYECNSRCKCKQTCLNRVAQHPLQLKLQVFKTENRGWGIRALNDVPKGAFLCVYAGNLLTDATANLDGLNEGDEYLAELDYIEVVEGMKEGYEDDIPDKDKEKDKNGSVRVSESESESASESEEEKEKSGKDDDFQPNAYIPQPREDFFFQKSLRKREKAKKKEEEKEKQKVEQAAKKREDCITISDDEEVREPSRFTADDIADKDTKHSSRVSVRKLYGEDEACYIMDAKVQGNIGRYLNHSCLPNVFVQNVFVDSHDPRFPWVAFFALTNVRAGNELTWNYNYDVGSVPGKVLYCYCGAPDCRGRLL